MLQDLATQIVLCRLAAQVSQYYKDIEELDSIQQLRKYLGQVLFPSLNPKIEESKPILYLCRKNPNAYLNCQVC